MQTQNTSVQVVISSLNTYTEQLAGEYLEMRKQVRETRRLLEAYEESRVRLKEFIQKEQKALAQLIEVKFPTYHDGVLGATKVWHPVDGWQDTTDKDAPIAVLCEHYYSLTDAERQLVGKSVETMDEMLEDAMDDYEPTQDEIDDYWLDQDLD